MDSTAEPVVRPPTIEERARWAARRGLHLVAQELADSERIGVQRTLPGLPSAFHDVQPDWGLRAALFLREATTAAIRDYAGQLRGQGATWHDLAEPLGLLAAAAEDDLPPGQAAFLFVVQGRRPGQSLSDDDARRSACYRPGLRWNCGQCRRRIEDSGPGRDPDDSERGHAPDCSRHTAAQLAYRQQPDPEG